MIDHEKIQIDESENIIMDPIISYLDRQLPRFLTDLGMLVNIDCGTHNKARVDTVGRLVRSRFRGIGCELFEFPVDDYGDCFMASLRGNGQARVLLVGHLDTVYPDGTADERPLRFEAGRAYGPGVTEWKNWTRPSGDRRRRPPFQAHKSV